MSEENNSNGFLYFAVGALLVAVIGIGYFYMKGQPSGDLAVIETSGGDQDTPDFNVEVDGDSFKASGESEN